MEKISNTKIEIPICHHLYSNCIQDIFVTLLKWRKKEYIRLFDNTWSFSFIQGSNSFNIDNYRGDFTQLFESLKINFGIELEFIFDLSNRSNFLKIIKELKIGKIIGACVDTYYCNWHKTYRRYHNEHYILIIGIEENSFICADPYVNKKFEKISFDQIIVIISKIFFITEKKFSDVKWDENVIRNVKKMFVGLNGKNDFEQILIFSDAIINHKSVLINDIKKYENIAFYPMILKFNNIGFGRKCFVLYLEWIKSQYSYYEFDYFIENINTVANDWAKLSSLFIKYIMSDFNDSLNKKISDKLKVISNKEEQLANEILKLLI